MNNPSGENAPKVSRRFLFGKGRGFKSRDKMDVEVEVKGGSENTGGLLELGLLRELEPALLVFTQRRLLDKIVSTISEF